LKAYVVVRLGFLPFRFDWGFVDRLSSFATADGSVSVFGWTCALHRCAFGDVHLSVPAGE
jgi:hypothetical protein